MTWALPALLALGLGLGQVAQAQDKPDPVEGVIVSPPTKIGLGACAPADYACLDKALKAVALTAQPADPVGLGDAVSADTPTRVGTFSQAATAQRLGSNFGRAATPWRPTTPATTSPILAHSRLAGRPTR